MRNLRIIVRLALLAGLFVTTGFECLLAEEGWVVGDWHMHTKMSDGSQALPVVFDQALLYGLDWFGSSDHGGGGTYDPFGVLWIERPEVVILGDYWENGLGIQGMWRWQALRQYAFPVVQDYRDRNPQKVIWQAFEWCALGANDATVAILGDDRYAISDFEYMFCRYDDDTSREDEGLVKQNETWEDAVAAAAWLESHHSDTGFISLNHPSRSLDWSPGEIRDLHNAGPSVVVGMEAIPGHQKSEYRGSYGETFLVQNEVDVTYKARTYGGADYMLAKVGGLWDSLLGEGRRFFVATNSDFHREAEDFWPGEYAKHYVYSEETADPTALVRGIESGRSFIVSGDLIDALEVEAEGDEGEAKMGGTLSIDEGDDVRVTIRFRSPDRNHNGDEVVVHHVDLILGEVTERKVPGTSDYLHGETNSTTRVEARFSRFDFDEMKLGAGLSQVVPERFQDRGVEATGGGRVRHADVDMIDQTPQMVVR